MAKAHIDFGHGGSDPGAIGNGLLEKDVNLNVGLEVVEILEEKGVEVTTSRTDDIFVSLGDRVKMANAAGADIFVSIHINGHSNTAANGLETFSYPGSSVGAILSKDIHEAVWKTGLFKANRGLKTANFQVLRQSKMPAALTELGFISNKDDADIIRKKANQSRMAKAIAKGILKHLGVEMKGTKIIGPATATIEQMQEWAKGKKANVKFVELAPLFYSVSNKVGVNPIVTYTQSAKETGYMKFGGVIDITYNNPCGLKTTQGGGNYDPSAHKRFKDWEEGIQAQVDHLALYAGANGYPKPGTPDPRHFPFIKGTAKTVEELGGKWAPSKTYGTDIVKMMTELENIVVEEKEEKNSDKIKISLHGKKLEVEGIYKDKTNYIPIRFLEQLGYKVEWEDGKVTINYKEE